mgnify:FL=1
MIRPADKAAARAEAARILAHLRALGAEEVEAAILVPSDVLLDLYGEDIRARAYVTRDPEHGELMLRPDFTVPVARMHMEGLATPARYAYAGEVFRRAEDGPRETLQVGFELFGGDREEADAEAFSALAGPLAGLPLRAAVGDVGLLLAAIEGLAASAPRKAALRRHLWRPRRFRALLDRFAGAAPDRGEVAAEGPEIGLRTREEVEARLALLREDAREAPIPAAQVAALDALLALDAPASEVPGLLAPVAEALPPVAEAAARLGRRHRALARRGWPAEELRFEGSFGRTTLEYYDGFVWGLFAEGRERPPACSGGRYDALTRALGRGVAVPAVGGIVRPEAVAALR